MSLKRGTNQMITLPTNCLHLYHLHVPMFKAISRLIYTKVSSMNVGNMCIGLLLKINFPPGLRGDHRYIILKDAASHPFSNSLYRTISMRHDCRYFKSEINGARRFRIRILSHYSTHFLSELNTISCKNDLSSKVIRKR